MSDRLFPIFDVPNWLKAVARTEADVGPQQIEIGPPAEGCTFKGDLSAHFVPDPDWAPTKKYPPPPGYEEISSSSGIVGYSPIVGYDKPGTAHFSDGSIKAAKK
jgi:hypothetical protein